MSFLKRKKKKDVGEKEEEGKNWPQVTTRVPTTSSREEKLLKKGKKEENVFDFFSYLIRFPDGWMDATAHSIHREKMSSKPYFLPFIFAPVV
jgi:hypothetical protein